MTQPAITTQAASLLSAPVAATRRWLRWFGRAAMMVLGLAIGLAVAEGVFSYRDGGAFPHLNVYVPDAELGVRLMPGATQNVAFGGNPITHVRINDDGFRGGALPAPGKDDVLVVGDSQVFGLGVEEDETFSARLGLAIGRPVMNGGIPTYGPAEYRAVIAEQLARRHPKTVVVTINLVNDLFEAQHPNKERHAVWDGWAVRKETAPEATTSFPGRDLLYRRSHLFFALRKWRHADDRTDERGVISEGTWRDIVTTGAHLQAERLAIDEARHQRLTAMTTAHAEIQDAEREIDDKIRSILSETTPIDELTLSAAHANPGDIVSDDLNGESARTSIATADQIATAARVRAQLRAQLSRWAKTHSSTDAKETLASIAASDGAFARLTQLDVERLTSALEPPLGAYLRDVQQLVEHAGARLVVLILPIDVQASPEEWKKYGATPIDMAPSQALTTELVALCRALGVSVLDTTPVLAQAEPGAFLDKDIHMTPKGHAAVAAALAKTLAEPAPVPVVASARSPVPLPDMFQHASVIVTGSSDAACETKQVREWLRIQCPRTEHALPVTAEITRDDGHEAMALVMPAEISLVIPVVEGRELTATLTWTDKTRVLHVAWPAGAKRPRLAFDKPIARVKPDDHDVFGTSMTFRSPVERAICDCWQVVFGGERYQGSAEVFTCAGAYGAPDPGCVERYYRTNASCPELLACTRRDPGSPR